VAPETPTRAACGLPERGFVYCAFNGPQKITPDVFAIWMEILRATPESVLWVLCPEESTATSLRNHGAAAGLDPGRLVFAGRMPNAMHLARYRLADLFLDTSPYGAHTTASDALWMGVPVLTCPGNSFAARVCGSLVRAAGLPEMVCADWDAYRHRAVALSQDAGRLAAIAQRLREGRDSCVLFDTPLLVRSLEDAYDAIWAEYRSGQAHVPSLRHLELYHEVGCTVDRPALPDRTALMHSYRNRIAYRHAVQPVAADGLLWNSVLDN
jgi:predicted O-linked N-acetylglucosamine transferase (SPINDLY family)